MELLSESYHLPIGATPPYLCLWRRNFCAAGGVLFSYSGAIFERSRSPFIDYSGAKYARSVPKIDLAWNHFFEQLKTAVLLIDCETATLKSLLSRGSDDPHVHPRLRKRPPRCTLDCGFKTSESPALRGFVGGLRALATAALYLVLKSNGLRHSKNPPVKFSFSLKIVPAIIAKKLPPQRCPKPPTFAFTDESGYTLGFRRKIAHSGSHGETRGVSDGGGITTLGPFRTFTNIPGPGVRTAYFAAFGP